MSTILIKFNVLYICVYVMILIGINDSHVLLLEMLLHLNLLDILILLDLFDLFGQVGLREAFKKSF